MENVIHVSPNALMVLELGEVFIKVRDLKRNTIKEIEKDDLLRLLSLCNEKKNVTIGRIPENSKILDIAYECQGDAMKVSMFVPAMPFKYSTERRTFSISSPPLLFCFHVKQQRIEETWIFALKNINNKSSITDETPLYIYPFSHVTGYGDVCWGNTVLPDIISLEVLELVPSAFWLNGMHSLSHVRNNVTDKYYGEAFYTKLEEGEIKIEDTLQPAYYKKYGDMWKAFSEK